MRDGGIEALELLVIAVETGQDIVIKTPLGIKKPPGKAHQD
jgi:hypothetical protein